MKNCVIFLLALLLFACHPANAPAPVVHPRSLAVARAVRVGAIEQTEIIPATTLYLQKNMLNAPITGYITGVHVKPGDAVRKGAILYTIESRERKALGSWPGHSDSSTTAYGVFSVTAPAAGYITRMDKQQPGEFVSEGSSLCAIADPATVFFQINVPYEEIGIVKANPVCSLLLPDGSVLQAHITQPLTQVSPGSQTAPFLARPAGNRFFPEGLIASVRLVVYRRTNAQLLPAKAILSDELMRSFWVMRLLNDSLAIRVAVDIGHKNDSLVEVLRPAFTAADRVLIDGNYGLPDTALVSLSPQSDK